MKKLLAFYFLNKWVKDPLVAVKVYQTLYGEVNSDKVPTNIKPKIGVTQTSKKEELLQPLEYLKSKSPKTSKDRESIYMIESVLKNLN